MPIIRSILEQDLYKFNMCANILRHHPRVPVTYKFKDRRPTGKFNKAFAEALAEELRHMSELRATDEEIRFLRKRCPYLPPQFLDFLRNFRYDPSQVQFSVDEGALDWSCEGPWETAMMWEVPIMATISELYFTHCDRSWHSEDWQDKYRERTIAKARALAPCTLSEFGLRRRHSYASQDLVVDTLSKHHENFAGVSNVHMAHKYDVKPIGTMAHELFMGYSVLEGMRHANRYVLRDWADTFQGEMGIALTDTFGTKAFFGDFQGYLARLFDGVRHDSGDPIEFGHKVIAHYKSLRIDPRTKTIVFSDGLNATRATEIKQHFEGQIKTAFGIGTSLTHDFPKCRSLNIVIKMWTCGGTPVVKLSDVASKQMGEPDALRVANWIFSNKALDDKA